MISNLVGISKGYDTFAATNDCSELYQSPTVCKISKISSCIPIRTTPASIMNWKFSPMRLLWWFSLVVGARAQLTDPFPASIELSSLNGTNGITFIGESANFESGISVSSAGDVNGDGMTDFVIGASRAGLTGKGNAGKSYIVFGSHSLGKRAVIDLYRIESRLGHILNGEAAGDHSGVSVSSAGDVNGDGIQDLVVGAYSADLPGRLNAGKSYVVFGSRQFGSNWSLELSNLNGTNGFVLKGEMANDQSGISVSSAGDVNGDGIDDLVIGAQLANPSDITNAGKSYLVFGSPNLGGGGSFELSSLNGSFGFALNGEKMGDESGAHVSSAGDVNDDGIADFVIGASQADPLGKSLAGKSYVVFGSRRIASNGTLELSSLNGGNGFVLNGEEVGDRSGKSVSSAGDVNGDGIADLVIGALFANPLGRSNAGKAYVVFGSRTLGSSGSFELSSLNGSNGFTLFGEVAGDQCGYSVSTAGDVNGDGIDDVLIGAFKATLSRKTNAGKSYVVFGSRRLGKDGIFDLSNLNGSNGFGLIGEATNDWSGSSVSSAGDVNGDGIDDILIGAQRADPIGRTNAGKCYLIFGRNLTERTRPVLSINSRSVLQTSSTVPSKTLLTLPSNPKSSSTVFEASSEKKAFTTLEFQKDTSVLQEMTPKISISTTQPNDQALITGLSVGGSVLALSCSIFGVYLFVSRKKNTDIKNPSDIPMDVPQYGVAPQLDEENGDSSRNSNYGLIPEKSIENEYSLGDIDLQDIK